MCGAITAFGANTIDEQIEEFFEFVSERALCFKTARSPCFSTSGEAVQRYLAIWTHKARA